MCVGKRGIVDFDPPIPAVFVDMVGWIVTFLTPAYALIARMLPVTEKAKAILIHLLGNDDLDVASTFSRLADAHFYNEEYAEAVKFYTLAVAQLTVFLPLNHSAFLHTPI